MPRRLRDYAAEYARRIIRGLAGGKSRPEAAGHHRKTFPELTERGQQRAYRQGERYGLDRRQVQDRYDRGTFKPFARDPAERVPQSVRQAPEQAPLEVQRQAAFEMASSLLAGEERFDADATRARIFEITDRDALVRIIRMEDLSQWQDLARHQIPGNPFFYH
jgi:hypothetical protein